MTARGVWSGLLAMVAFAVISKAFPSGAPIESCILPTPNQPNHAGTKALAPHLSKHVFTASSSKYGPGDIIHVRISGPPFKGFFVQARDPHSENWIGEFVEAKDIKTHPECSAVTHREPRLKSDVRLVWKAPFEHPGDVYFTGTVLHNYTTYWSNMAAKVPNIRGNGFGF